MIDKTNFDISAYFVVGPENTNGREVGPIIKAAIEAGFTFIQIRSKTASAIELINLTAEAAKVIENSGLSNEVTLLVDDRLDIVLAARERGIKVDGIHVGQTDIPVDVCRKYLGEEAIIGLSAPTEDLFEYIEKTDISQIDYFGAGPLHETRTKVDCGEDSEGNIVTRSFEDIRKLTELSPIPIVLGGGVKLKDIPQLAQTGVDGFFVVSAISQAENPKEEAVKLYQSWKTNKGE